MAQYQSLSFLVPSDNYDGAFPATPPQYCYPCNAKYDFSGGGSVTVSATNPVSATSRAVANCGLDISFSQGGNLSIFGSKIGYASSTGPAISLDAGVTWKNYNGADFSDNSTTCKTVFYDSSNGKAYAARGSNGLWVSSDDGASWSLVTSAYNFNDVYANGNTIYGAVVSGFAKSTDGGSTWTLTGFSSASCNSITVFGSTIFVTHNATGFRFSTNAGVSWTNITTTNGLPSNFVSFVVENGGTWYASTDSGLAISTNNGASWTTKTTANGLASNFVNGVYANGSKIYAATNQGMSLSLDGGTTWSTVFKGPGQPVRVKENSGIVWVILSVGIAKTSDDGASWTLYTLYGNSPPTSTVFSVYSNGSSVYYGTSQTGLYISQDSGVTWNNYQAPTIAGNVVGSVYVSGSNLYVGTTLGLSLSTNGGSTWVNKTTANGLVGNSVNSVYAIGSTIYVATSSGISISSDSGSTWANQTTANGLASNTCTGIYASGSEIYVATNAGVSVSTDSGSTWATKTTGNGLGSNTVNSVYATGGTIYAATSGGLSLSTNSGVSWSNRTTSDGLGSNAVNSVSSSGSNVYAATNGGVSISSDGGTTWTNKSTSTSNLFNNNAFNAIRVEGSTIYAGSAANSGLAVSTDNGTSWVSFGGNNRIANYADLRSAFYDNSTGKLYATSGGSSGLFVSLDDGVNWATFSRFAGIAPATIHNVFANGSNVYLATSSGVFFSTNSGATWTQRTVANSGLASDTVFQIYASGSTFYAATSGGVSYSTNSGSSWSNRTVANSGLASNTVNGVFVDGATIYASTASGLSVSTNTGTSWTNYLPATVVNKAFASGTTIYAATTSGLSFSTNGGTSFTSRTAANSGLASNTVSSVYSIGNTLFAATDRGLCISSDNGATWNTYSYNISTPPGGGAPSAAYFTAVTGTGLLSNAVRGVFATANKFYLATTNGPVVGTYSNGSLSGLFTVDGVPLQNGYRVFVVNASNAVDSGIYSASSGAWYRTQDMKAGDNATKDQFIVTAGTLYGGTRWTCTSSPAIVGVNSLNFSQLA